jgi:hypothetical protein
MPLNRLPNAIDRVFSRESLKRHHGEETVKKLKEEYRVRHPLNFMRDDPVPEWAISILRDSTVGYRTRIRILMMHQYDIINMCPTKVLTENEELTKAPESTVPSWLVDAREMAAERAIKILKKYKRRRS